MPMLVSIVIRNYFIMNIPQLNKSYPQVKVEYQMLPIPEVSPEMIQVFAMWVL